MVNQQVIKFDRARPYAEVLGQPGLAYQQDGYAFNGRGEVVTAAEQAKLKPVDAPEPQPTPDDGSIPRCVIAEDQPKSSRSAAEGSVTCGEPEGDMPKLESMHWKKLQKMCNVYGIDYVNREQAISDLKGKK